MTPIEPALADATTAGDDPPAAVRRGVRPSPLEWTLIAAMACTLLVVLLPRLHWGAKDRNEHAAAYHCFVLHRAERELQKLPVGQGRAPYTSPQVLAGNGEYLPGIRCRTLDRSWADLGPDDEVDTAFGYRAGFFLDVEARHWALVLWPREWGVTGDAAYAVTQDGDIRRTVPANPVAWQGKDAIATAAWGSPAAAASAANTTWGPGWEPAGR
jgi:hypothetical protein